MVRGSVLMLTLRSVSIESLDDCRSRELLVSSENRLELIRCGMQAFMFFVGSVATVIIKLSAKRLATSIEEIKELNISASLEQIETPDNMSRAESPPDTTPVWKKVLSLLNGVEGLCTLFLITPKFFTGESGDRKYREVHVLDLELQFEYRRIGPACYYGPLLLTRRKLRSDCLKRTKLHYMTDSYWCGSHVAW